MLPSGVRKMLDLSGLPSSSLSVEGKINARLAEKFDFYSNLPGFCTEMHRRAQWIHREVYNILSDELGPAITNGVLDRLCVILFIQADET